MNTAHVLSLLATQTLELSAVIALVWVLSVTVFHRRPQLAYALWMVVLVKAVTPPVWSCPTGVFSWALREWPSVSVVQPKAITADFSALPRAHQLAPPLATTPPAALLLVTPSAGSAPAASAPLHVMRAAAAILLAWSTGTALVFTTILIMTARLRRRVFLSAVGADHPALGRLTAISLNCTPRIVVSGESIGPVLIGVWGPLIVIPLHLVETLCDSELRAIIAHETTHLRRGDHWVAAFQRLVISIWWFNPLVWLAHHQINRARELCCDGQTVASLDCDPADYAQMLVDVLRSRRGVASAQSLFPGVHGMQIVNRRLSVLLTTPGNWRRRTPASAWVVLIAAGLVMIPGAGLVRTLAAEPAVTTASAPGQSRPSLVFHGMLSDIRQGWPVKGATVRISFSGSNTALNRSTFVHDLGGPIVTTTGADGRFDVVVPGDLAAQDPSLLISVQMYHPRYGARGLVNEWLPGFKREASWLRENAPDRATMPRLDIHLIPADQLTGTLAGPDHRPLADATVAVMSMNLSPVSLLSDSVRTDAAGRFTVPAFPYGKTSLLMQPKDAAAFRVNPTAEVEDGRIDIGRVVAPSGRAITGAVSDANGKPLVGWTVAARPVPNPSNLVGFDDTPARAGVTDATGRFDLPPVAVGTVQLTVTPPAGTESQEFSDGMSVPETYFQMRNSGGFTPVVVTVSANGPGPTVDLRPTPQVRVVIKSVDPLGHPAEPLATFVTGEVNGLDGAWLALQSGPDTVETLVPKGVTDARVGINDLSADDHRTVARVRRGDGPAVDAGMADLGTLDHDVTDLTVVRFPRPKLTITITDPDGRALPAALTAVRYARPSPGNPYWDRLARGSGSPQALRSYEVFPGQPFTLSTTLDGYTTDTRDLTLGWKADRTVAVRLTPAATRRPEKAD